MESVILFVFVIGYLLIALEHPVKINKTATALVTGVLCWTLFVVSEPGQQLLSSESYLNFIEEAKSKATGAILHG
ncbi:MAG: sodium:proton antiporter, partial [Cyclobacteriaceae bacterium]